MKNNIIFSDDRYINSLEQCFALREEDEDIILGWYIEGELIYSLLKIKKIWGRKAIFRFIEKLQEDICEDIYIEKQLKYLIDDKEK